MKKIKLLAVAPLILCGIAEKAAAMDWILNLCSTSSKKVKTRPSPKQLNLRMEIAKEKEIKNRLFKGFIIKEKIKELTLTLLKECAGRCTGRDYRNEEPSNEPTKNKVEQLAKELNSALKEFKALNPGESLESLLANEDLKELGLTGETGHVWRCNLMPIWVWHKKSWDEKFEELKTIKNSFLQDGLFWEEEINRLREQNNNQNEQLFSRKKVIESWIGMLEASIELCKIAEKVTQSRLTEDEIDTFVKNGTNIIRDFTLRLEQLRKIEKSMVTVEDVTKIAKAISIGIENTKKQIEKIKRDPANNKE